jgi:hypothetical protein
VTGDRTHVEIARGMAVSLHEALQVRGLGHCGTFCQVGRVVVIVSGAVGDNSMPWLQNAVASIIHFAEVPEHIEFELCLLGDDDHALVASDNANVVVVPNPHLPPGVA